MSSTTTTGWTVGYNIDDVTKRLTLFRGNGRAEPENGRAPLGEFLGATGPGSFPPPLQEYVDLSCRPDFSEVPQHLVFRIKNVMYGFDYYFINLSWEVKEGDQPVLWWNPTLNLSGFGDRMYQITRRHGLMVEVDDVIYCSEGRLLGDKHIGGKRLEFRDVIQILQYLEGRITEDQLAEM